MEIEKIKELLRHPESSDLEFKESLHSQQDISEVICAFANTDGGIILIGADMKGNIVGLKKDPDETQQKLSACGQSVSPAPLMDVGTVVIDQKRIVYSVIHKADSNNFHMYKGAVYIRRGSTTMKLDGPAMVEFLKTRQILCFDELTDRAKLEDIDEKRITYYLAKIGNEDYLKTHTIKDLLISLNLASENGQFKIKNGAILSFSKNPQFWFPQSEVKVAKFSGIEPVDVISHDVLEGSAAELIDKAYAFVLKNISKQMKLNVESPQREDIYEYPPKVIREAITNAIAHRDYFNINSVQINIFDDRLEIVNPGGLPKGLSEQLFGTISVQRNRLTYKILRDMKYIEGLGLGIPRIRNEMRRSGLFEPEFLHTDSFFRITLRNIKSKIKPIDGVKDLNERQIRAIEYLRTNRTIKTQQYAKLNNISNTMALLDLKELLNHEYLKKVGSFRGAYYTLNEKKFK
jgi:ATP-dependent DNA helicase RecG